MTATTWTRTRRRAPTLLGLALVGLVGCGGGEPAEEEMVEEAPEAAPAPTMPDAPVLDATELQTNAAAHEGQTVRLNNMMVQSAVGTNAVWVELPNKNPFLVRTDNPPSAGAHVDVVGEVRPVNEALVNEWVSSGAITENDKLVVEFATHYIDAQAVEPTAGAGM